MNRGLGIACAALAVLLNVGCARKDEGSVLLILKSLNNPFFIDMQEGFQEEWNKVGGGRPVIVKAGNTEEDVETQRLALDTQFSKDVSGRSTPNIVGLVLTPSSSGADLVPQVKKFRDAGVPVILLDTAIQQAELDKAKTDYNLMIASDNRAGGRIAATEFGSALQGKACRILLLNGVAGQDSARERREGFLEEIGKHNCTVTIEKTANWQRRDAYAAVSLMAATLDVTGIFAANDEMAIGASTALRQAQVKDAPLIIGFDAIKPAVEAVKAGQMHATVAQDARGMGRQAAKAMAAYLADPKAVPRLKTETLAPTLVK